MAIILMLGGIVSIIPSLIHTTFPNAEGVIIKNLFFDDMETGGPADLGLWRTQDTLLVWPRQPSVSQWELGTPSAPPNSHSSTDCWGTELTGAYMSPSEYLLMTPTIDLSSDAVLSAKLTFWHTYSFKDLDGGFVEVNPRGFSLGDIIIPEGDYPGNVKTTRALIYPGYNPSNSGWEQAIFDLSDYIGQTITIGFRFSGLSADMIARGWYIDDVSVDAEWYDGPIIEDDQTKIGLGGDTLSYSLTITNYNIIPDFIDIRFTDTNNWQVRILNATTYLPLQDNGGLVGFPDVFLVPEQSIDIIVNVTIPIDITEWDIIDTTTIYVVSYDNPLNQDTAVLITKTPWPDVGIDKISTPLIKMVGQTVYITVTVKNYGDYLVSFDVEGLISAPLINPPSTNESPIQSILNLGPQESVNLQWSFVPTIVSEYTFSATTLLNIDQFVFNNKSTESIIIQEIMWTDDMETGGDAANGLWAHFINGGSPSFTDWELGRPTYGPPAGSVPSPLNCWGTDLNSAYQEGTDCYLFTPASRAFDFTGFEEIILAFSHWWKLQSTPHHGEDYGIIVYTFDPDPVSTVYMPGIQYTTNSSGWEYEEIDMTSYVKDQPYVRFGWRLFEDIKANKFEPNSWPGWYVDDVEVWASPARPEPIITEVVDSGGDEYIEIFNEGSKTAQLSDFGITLDNGASWLSSGSWNAPSLSPNDHTYYRIPVGIDELNDQGETISIVDRSIPEGLITGQISYGQKGIVPDPIPGESTARYWDGSRYRNEWARDTTSTIGTQNNGQGEVSFKYVVLNEVLYNPGTIDGFIELRYVGYPGNDPNTDVDGWIVVAGDLIFTIPSGPYSTVLNLNNPFYVINETMFPTLFNAVNVNGDNVYLYTSTGEFVDEVGWNNAHTPDTSLARVPDGYGVKLGFKKHGLMGFDDPSSIAAGWQFLRIPSMSIVAIEADQKGLGDVGWTVVYDLCVTNHQNVADYIDLISSTPSPGWIIEFCAQDNVTLLTDNDGDGIIDTGLVSVNSITWIKLKITLPTEHIGDFDETIITARSSVNPNGWDTVTIITETYPHIEVDKYASKDEIWLNGTGMFPQATTLTLEVKGSGLAQSVQYSQDVIFCIDSSGSMGTNDPQGLRKDAAKAYVDDMRVPDRGAVVDFDSTATLVRNDHLSSNYVQIKNNIDTIDSMGGTAIGAALQLANDELIAYGDPAHIWIIILLTDGISIDDALCYSEAERAFDNDIKIYTIGLGDNVDEVLLEDIAEITGGKYYPAPTPEYLEGIYFDIRTHTMNIAGKDMVVGDNVYFIKDVLPPWIDFVPGTFNVVPSRITIDPNGYTILEWEIDRIIIGEIRTYTFDVVSNKPGLVHTNSVSDSRVRYVKWTGAEVEELFPEVLVNVKLGPPLPLRLYSKVVGNDVQLYWVPNPNTGIDHYLIYKSPTQTGFDFQDVWINTSLDSDNGVISTRTTWNISGAALDSYAQEEYYIIRVVNSLGEYSMTSNTAGKWTKTFYKGGNTFSLPLEPFEIKTTNWYLKDIPNCSYIKWMNKTTHTWIRHDSKKGFGVDDADVILGDGYEIYLSGETVYTFCGSPGAQIRYLEGELPAPQNFNVDVINTFGDVKLTWNAVFGADHYIVYRSTTRMGLNNLALLPYTETTYGDPMDTSFIDSNAAYFGGTQYYYFVCAVGAPGLHVGLNSSYSMGVWTGDYLGEYDTFALPLKLNIDNAADWYCDNIPNTVGMNYYIYPEQRWGWHATLMPPGAYDPDIIMAEGFQISTLTGTKYTFIGV
jgi:hypothetical protein